MRILLVEDDAALAAGVRTALRPEGYTVDCLDDGPHALQALLHGGYELAVLDLGLPRMDGLDVLRQLRASGSAVPVLVLTARDATADRIAGLDAGADDYLVKPFEVDELKARLRALLRRAAGRPQPVVEHRGVRLEPAAQAVFLHGRAVSLSRREFAILHELLAQPGRVLTREQLEGLLYGWGEEIESNAIEVHIHHLRRKLFPGLIRTLRGIGYVIDKAGADEAAR
ncbi:response regulator transcription factor [Thauera sp. CAU 1555]|uniref:Response regulator transcription factor n=1 Tax=Thauera sedimentorum TaxID=2767595 RepID=A0ABR9BBE9_9RHOO|nr:response regulator transcription factor [Thauera sedimentorum]MBC9072444.1 response regulator transcription factor [Thauera sedimentorum]MBD8503363.1 response regulator transcription factor [Thauera sedimentorum]